ncbi:unnamed protein product [Mytilus coruscus]|uniref:Uncharacterized protein n=1 Tax=Mytilus coruscus TaxID=42192 RepID=A0A6J8BXJ6_MYTCO|nr:unnamed protein product [Mytilus coruscus]
MSRVRQSNCTEVGESVSEGNVDNEQVSFLNDIVGPSKLRVVSALRRVSTKQSPHFKAFYKHFPLELTLDTDAEVSMIKASSADYIGVTMKKSNHSALQADGVAPFNIVAQHINRNLSRQKSEKKNPVADKAIAELEDESFREELDQSPLSENTLVIATTRLNSRLRQRGLSSRELWTQRNQFTREQLPFSDMNLIRAQHEARNKNHGFREISKCSRPGCPIPDVSIGDLVYLYTDRSKTQSRDWYLVVARDGEWCFIKNCSCNQLRA